MSKTPSSDRREELRGATPKLGHLQSNGDAGDFNGCAEVPSKGAKMTDENCNGVTLQRHGQLRLPGRSHRKLFSSELVSSNRTRIFNLSSTGGDVQHKGILRLQRGNTLLFIVTWGILCLKERESAGEICDCAGPIADAHKASRKRNRSRLTVKAFRVELIKHLFV